MNRSKIEWCDFTWNPVTGCYHGCEYCYARRIAHRFLSEHDRRMIIQNNILDKSTVTANRKRIWDIDDYIHDGKCRKTAHPFGFEPTLHRYRLHEPGERKKPARIFVSSMGDLFGNWVPGEWQNKVFEACLNAPQHTYFFLTKNPKGISMINEMPYKYPNNWYFGTTVNGIDDDFERIEELYCSHNNFWSIEPLLGDPEQIINYIGMELYEPKWVIVGAQTGPGAVQPKKEWIEKIIRRCRMAHVPVFLKDNLNWTEKIQEFPEVY